jgi:hypothetical protein
MKKTLFLALFFLPLLSSGIGSEQKAFLPLSGPYLGQKPPGMTPEVFAPGIVSSGLEETVIAFMPDGKECFWSILLSGFETILTSRLEKGGWTEPEVASFAGSYYDGWPAIQPDGKRMFFHSARPLMNGASGKPATFNIWYVDRNKNGWGEPMALGAPVNDSENATCPSATKDGTIYFSKRFSDNSEKICRSRLVNGRYQELEILPAVINTSNDNFHAVISPDENYLIRPLYKRAEAIGGGWNYYVSFRSRNDQWSELVNLGEGINSVRCSGASSVSADGKYLFLQFWTPPIETFALERKYSFKEMVEKENRYPSSYSTDIYWISAKIIREMKPKKAAEQKQ